MQKKIVVGAIAGVLGVSAAGCWYTANTVGDKVGEEASKFTAAWNSSMAGYSLITGSLTKGLTASSGTYEVKDALGANVLKLQVKAEHGPKQWSSKKVALTVTPEWDPTFVKKLGTTPATKVVTAEASVSDSGDVSIEGTADATTFTKDKLVVAVSTINTKVTAGSNGITSSIAIPTIKVSGGSAGQDAQINNLALKFSSAAKQELGIPLMGGSLEIESIASKLVNVTGISISGKNQISNGMFSSTGALLVKSVKATMGEATEISLGTSLNNVSVKPLKALIDISKKSNVKPDDPVVLKEFKQILVGGPNVSLDKLNADYGKNSLRATAKIGIEKVAKPEDLSLSEHLTAELNIKVVGELAATLSRTATMFGVETQVQGDTATISASLSKSVATMNGSPINPEMQLKIKTNLELYDMMLGLKVPEAAAIVQEEAK